MKARFPVPEQINNAIITTLILTLGAVSVLLCSPTDSRAQQEPNRQLVQTNSPSTGNARRIALVIGNGGYINAPPLKNPPNDARDMAATLKALGFEVTSGINVSQREMKRLIREFGQKLKAGGNGLFYYAGHGVQSKGHNYIIPVDAEIQSEADVEDSG
ncbi:MAG: caspase family protein, partial [Acidobacteriota bacterium]|nr:caspase family protein [Acidobacteriota bacterium]